MSYDESLKNDDLLNNIARNILKEVGNKYFRLVNEQLFIFSKQKGIFVPYVGNKEYKLLLLDDVLKKIMNRAIVENIELLKKQGIADTENDIKYISKKLSKELRKRINNKLTLNSMLYSVESDKVYPEIVIPIDNRKVITDNQFNIVQKLQYKHEAYSYIKFKTDNQINAVLRNNNLYLEFLKSIAVNNTMILSQAKWLIRDISLNIAIENRALYIIDYSDRRILDLFLLPIYNLMHSDFISHFKLRELTKNLGAMTGKKLNIIDGVPQNLSTRVVEILLQHIINGKKETFKRKNILNKTVHIIMANREETARLKEKVIKQHPNLEFIVLPDKIDDKYLEPDFLLDIIDNNEQVLELAFLDVDVDSEAYNSIVDYNIFFWKNYLEITGSKEDFIYKKELYERYCDFCKQNNYTPKDDASFGKFICSCTGYRRENSLNVFNENSEQIFISNKSRDGYRWVGVRYKEITGK